MRRDPHHSRAKCHSPVPGAVVRPSCKRYSTDESLAVVKEDRLSDVRCHSRSDDGPEPAAGRVSDAAVAHFYTLVIESCLLRREPSPTPSHSDPAHFFTDD